MPGPPWLAAVLRAAVRGSWVRFITWMRSFGPQVGRLDFQESDPPTQRQRLRGIGIRLWDLTAFALFARSIRDTTSTLLATFPVKPAPPTIERLR